MTSIPKGCTWDGPADARSLQHVMDCPACADTWPQIAREMRIARGKALPSDDPTYLGSNVGYKDK